MNEPQIPTQNSEDLYVEELERVEEELKKKKKADDETKAYCEQPPESPPRRTVAEEARWSPKTPVTDMPSFDLGISPWVSWNSSLVSRIITIPEKNFNTPSSPQIIDLTMMEREPAKYQMIVSPQVAVHVINLDEEESDIEIELTEEDSGRTTSSLGMYSYVAQIKNKQRRPAKRDDIYWWGEVKNTREKKTKEIAEERKKNLEQKRKNKIGEGD